MNYKLVNTNVKWTPTESEIIACKKEVIATGEKWKKAGIKTKDIMVQYNLEGQWINWRLYDDFINIEVDDINRKISKEDVIRGAAYAIWNHNTDADEWEQEINKVSFYLAHGVDMNEDIVIEQLQKTIKELENE